MTHAELLEAARLILSVSGEPARLAALEQVVAQGRDEGLDGAEILADALEALSRSETPREELLASDVAYVGALLLVNA